MKAELSHACTQANDPNVGLKRCTDTRWNSLAECIERALLLRRAITYLLAQARFNDLRRYKLSDLEWNILSDLNEMLGVS